MNKKYLSVILFGALMLGTTGTFTSCKDYDDDINNLQSQIDKLATKEDMEAKLSQMQSAINDAKATAEEALKAAQEAGDAEEIAKLEARVKALEDAAIDVDALKKEIADSVEAQMADFREEMEELLKKVEELTGYSLGMVTGISFQANDNGLSPDLNVNYARIATITYPKDLLPSYTDGNNYGSSEGASKESATSYEFGKGLSGAFTVNKGDVNTVPDYMLVNVDPVNAAISKDMLSLINGKGQNLNEYIDLSISEWSDNIKITRAAASTGLREISVQLKNTVDFEAFDKLVLFPGKTEHDQAGCNKTHDYIAYALAVTDVDKSRTVTSPFEVTMHVLEEQVAENIKGKTTVYSYDASIPETAIGAYNKGGDAAVGDEGCYPVQLATPFEVNVNSEKGKVMASYIVVDYDNKSLSTTDKAALKGMTFAGVDQVKKDLYHAITISGTYATGIPVPLKLVTIDYTGNVEVNVFWVKVGEPVLMDANFTVTPTTHVTTPEAWMPASSMEAFKVPAGTSTFSIALIAGETAHQDPSQFVAVKANFATEITDYLNPLMAGEPMGVISEAGCPAIADPGADVVAMAQSRGLKVVPLVGPSSILMSLMASGFNGQSFAFQGYLPIEAGKRTKKLHEMERAIAGGQTQIFIETPYRNNKLIAELCATLRSDLRLCVACNITGNDETILTRTIREWGKMSYNFDKRPAIFLLYR